MGELLIPILIVILPPVVIILLRLVKGFEFPVLHKVDPNTSSQTLESDEPSSQPDPKTLSCSVQLTKQEKDNSTFDVFSMEIYGSIHAPSDMHFTIVRISITDVTDGTAEPVQTQVKRWQIQDSSIFCYNADLGNLPHQVTTLSDWMTVGQIHLDWLRFPHKGKRDLRFSTSILSRESGEELACATCTFTHENTAFGYIDLQENTQRTKTLAVAAAFAVSAVDNKLFDCEVELIKNWARNNIDFTQATKKAKRKLEKALKKTVAFFRNGNQIDTYKICKEIVEIAPIAQRYDILNLCLHVVQANGIATEEELTLLKNLAGWLEVDANRFHTMMEKILPVSMHEVEDAEVILGVTLDMSKEETRQRLNKEYSKWNARVTNSDSEIKTQADYMLKFIAEARSAYIG